MSNPTELPDVKKILSEIKGRYYLQEEGEPIPVCKGCFNVGGSCGTPCVNCERRRAWDKKWTWDLMLEGKYTVWRRITKGYHDVEEFYPEG